MFKKISQPELQFLTLAWLIKLASSEWLSHRLSCIMCLYSKKKKMFSCFVNCSSSKAQVSIWKVYETKQVSPHVDPRIQLSFTVFSSLHWPSPGHAVTCLAHKHVTICPKVYNLAKTGWTMPNPDTPQTDLSGYKIWNALMDGWSVMRKQTKKKETKKVTRVQLTTFL